MRGIPVIGRTPDRYRIESKRDPLRLRLGREGAVGNLAGVDLNLNGAPGKRTLGDRSV